MIFFGSDVGIVVMLKCIYYLELFVEVFIIGEIMICLGYVLKCFRKMGWGDRINKISKILIIVDVIRWLYESLLCYFFNFVNVWKVLW